VSRPRFAGAPPVFLPLLASYPVLYLATANPGQASWATVGGAMLAAILIAMVVYALLRAVARSATSAGVATVLLVVMFFSYGQVVSWIDTLMVALRLGDHQTPNILDSAPGARRAIALVWAALGLLGAWLIARAAWADKAELRKAMTFAALLLLAFAAVSTLRQPDTSRVQAENVAARGPAGQASGATDPDVYFIVLDGYARQDVLAKYYRFDNSPFLDGLRKRGFGIAERSSSNYNWTFLSLASTLNLGYLQDLFPGSFQPASTDRAVLYEGIRNSLTSRFLRERGYRIVHFQSTWGATAVNPYADREMRCEFSMYGNEFVRTLVEASWLGAFHSKAGTDLAGCHLANFKALGAMGQESGPKFVFAHFILPHHPYLFDRDGNVLRNAVISNQFEFQKRLWEDRASYVSQLEFTNKKVLEAVDGILAGSSTPPIIVIESDHGPGLAAGISSGEHYALRFANLGAYHLPGAPDGLIPQDGTAVNQFRRILSHYFDAKLEPLPDRHFVSSYGKPYAFREMPHDFLVDLWTRMNARPQAADVPNPGAPGVEQTDE
jgi:hypothetical protein